MPLKLFEVVITFSATSGEKSKSVGWIAADARAIEPITQCKYRSMMVQDEELSVSELALFGTSLKKVTCGSDQLIAYSAWRDHG